MTGSRVLGGIGEAFADRNFRIYSLGSIASWTSYFVQLVAVSWLTWQLTASTVWLALMALLDIVPGVLLMPLTGVFADRYDRHRIMIWVCTLSLFQAVVLAVFCWMDNLGIALLAILVFIHSILIAFMVPAMYGVLPRFVAKASLPSAIAVGSSYVQIAICAGPAFAGWIIASYGVSWAFIVNALGYLVLCSAFMALKTPDNYEQQAAEPGSIFEHIRDGILYLLRDRRILTFLMLAVIVNAMTIGLFHMLPAYSELILGMGVEGMSIMLAVQGLGATAAALWMARGGVGLATDARIIWSVLVAVVAAAALICTANFYMAIAISLVLGIASEIRKTGTMTAIQMGVEDRQRGRVMGTWYMFSQIAGGIGAYGVGQAAVAFGLRLPTVLFCGLCVTLWLVIYLNRRKLLGDNLN